MSLIPTSTRNHVDAGAPVRKFPGRDRARVHDHHRRHEKILSAVAAPYRDEATRRGARHQVRVLADDCPTRLSRRPSPRSPPQEAVRFLGGFEEFKIAGAIRPGFANAALSFSKRSRQTSLPANTLARQVGYIHERRLRRGRRLRPRTRRSAAVHCCLRYRLESANAPEQRH